MAESISAMTESHSNDATLPRREIPTSLRVAATLLRGIFLCLLGLVTLRVTMPEKETLFSAYTAWGDLIRMALGLARLRVAGDPAFQHA
jgi:hypothetical protein